MAVNVPGLAIPLTAKGKELLNNALYIIEENRVNRTITTNMRVREYEYEIAGHT